MDRRGLVAHAVAAVETRVLLRVARLQRSLPGADRLLELADDERDRMEAQVAADRRVREPRSPQQRGCVERAARDDDGTRPHLHGPGVDADGRTSLDDDALRVRSDEHARAGRDRVGEPRLRGPVLRAERAAEAAVAADAVLVAASHVARLRADVPPERLCSALEHAVAAGSIAVLAR